MKNGPFPRGIGGILMIMLGVFSLPSCKKELTPQQQQQNKADEFQNFLVSSKKFHLTAYYSDIPVDYIEWDSVVLQETDLWKYVRDYIKDDEYVFKSTGEFEIIQNAMRIPNDLSDTIQYQYGVYNGGDQVGFNFYDYEYLPLTYKLDSISDSSFVVYVNRGSAKIFSKYEIEP